MTKRITDAEILAAVPEALRAEVQKDLINTRAMNLAFDAIFNSTWSDDTETCQVCGRKSRPRCNCGDVDPPTPRPDTGWGL